ncbi:PREDICTED: uncharacterized protein LOC109192415 [Ipomoea nil]|uniref:uncharacterized protein LOC109192415 n=1 Tax=Ipomoea nil TaxID=35883 RepID=UPI0009008B3F|nr:PREDICTED: uncharacterized protein LOC109192415 [Ipomoea nil]
MECCNKTDALRAKEMAERKLTEKDFVGAQELALRAQTMFAGLDGLSKLLEVINIHVRSQRKINGEVDWYAVFGVDSSVGDEALRRRYRKMEHLRLLLKPGVYYLTRLRELAMTRDVVQGMF